MPESRAAQPERLRSFSSKSPSGTETDGAAGGEEADVVEEDLAAGLGPSVFEAEGFHLGPEARSVALETEQGDLDGLPAFPAQHQGEGERGPRSVGGVGGDQGEALPPEGPGVEPQRDAVRRPEVGGRGPEEFEAAAPLYAVPADRRAAVAAAARPGGGGGFLRPEDGSWIVAPAGQPDAGGGGGGREKEDEDPAGQGGAHRCLQDRERADCTPATEGASSGGTGEDRRGGR